MIYSKEHINGTLNKYLSIHSNLGHSKLADVIHTANDLGSLSHRQLRKYISDLRDEQKGQTSGNILIVGDLHSPFILEGYLEFCLGLVKKHDVSRTIFIGDITDQHALSFHPVDPDGYGPGQELDRAIDHLKPWYEAFPGSVDNPIDVMMGNHDYRIWRQGKAAKLPKKVFKTYKEILETPEHWYFHDNDLEIGNDIIVTHGTIGDALTRAKAARQSVIQGHLHTQAYVQWAVSKKDKIFGMQTGCGIDRSVYAMAYAADNAKKPIISAGLLLDGGKLPVVELMNL